MNEVILNKLHTALYSISPLKSDRDKVIEQMGETIWLESLEKMLMALPEDKRAQVIEALNNDDLDKGMEIMETSDIDVEAIIIQVSASVMDEVVSTGTQK